MATCNAESALYPVDVPLQLFHTASRLLCFLGSKFVEFSRLMRDALEINRDRGAVAARKRLRNAFEVVGQAQKLLEILEESEWVPIEALALPELDMWPLEVVF